MKANREKTKTPFWRLVVDLLLILVLAVGATILLQSFVIKSFGVTSSSMSPTIEPGDKLMADRITFYFRKPRRGDIVLFRYPPTGPQSMNTTNLWYWPFEQIGETLHLAHRNTSPPFVKRVVATEGETLHVKDGLLYINGKQVKEPYAVRDASNFGPVKVGPGMVYCFGDNRPDSNDSRYWGPVPVRSIIGRAVFRYWPFSRFGMPQG